MHKLKIEDHTYEYTCFVQDSNVEQFYKDKDRCFYNSCIALSECVVRNPGNIIVKNRNLVMVDLLSLWYGLTIAPKSNG